MIATLTMLASLLIQLEAQLVHIPTAEATTTPVLVETLEQRITRELGPEFVKIAQCESGMRQFNADGSVLISRTSDVGIFQINQVHWQEAKNRGIDIYTVEGNIAFAKILKGRGGTQPWFMSKHCWSVL